MARGSPSMNISSTTDNFRHITSQLLTANGLNRRGYGRFGYLARLFLALVASVAMIAGASAAPVAADRAYKAAGNWLGVSGKPGRRPSATLAGKAHSYATVTGETGFHVVDLDGGGFVVLAADDGVEPVVAFSDSSLFLPQAGWPLYNLLQRDMAGRLARMRAEAAKAKGVAPKAAGNQTKWQQLLSPKPQSSVGSQPLPTGTSSVLDPRVDPFVKSKWNQSNVSGMAVYNYYTPPNAPGSTSNYVAGCVATACSQVLRYHQWPVDGVGTASYSISVDGVSRMEPLRGGDGAGGPYDWSSMVLVPNSSIALAERQAIGALLHDAGVAMHMGYTSSESGAWMGASAMKSIFKYANAAETPWSDLPGIQVALKSNLDAGLPVTLAIYNSTSGHEVVADGYGYNDTTLYHHINMGWGGSNDAWYNLPTIDDSFYGFTSVDQAVFNVDPLVTGELLSGRVTKDDGSAMADVIKRQG